MGGGGSCSSSGGGSCSSASGGGGGRRMRVLQTRMRTVARPSLLPVEQWTNNHVSSLFASLQLHFDAAFAANDNAYTGKMLKGILSSSGECAGSELLGMHFDLMRAIIAGAESDEWPEDMEDLNRDKKRPPSRICGPDCEAHSGSSQLCIL